MSTRRHESEEVSRWESRQEKGKDSARNDTIYGNMRPKYRSRSPDTSGYGDRNRRSRHRSPNSGHSDRNARSRFKSRSPDKSDNIHRSPKYKSPSADKIGYGDRNARSRFKSRSPDKSDIIHRSPKYKSPRAEKLGYGDRNARSRLKSRSPDKSDNIHRSPKYTSPSTDKLGYGDRNPRPRYKSHSPDESYGGYGGRGSSRNENDRSRKRNAIENPSSVGSLPPEEKRGFVSEGRKDRSHAFQGVAGQNTLPDLYSIQKGKVRSIRPYGVFVNLYNYQNNGLVHLSQISNHEITNKDDSDELKVQAIGSVVEEGEEVWVKVISIKHEEDGSVKLGCSLKYVSQSDGRDLDPTNLQLDQQQSRPTWQAPSKLVLDAVYNVTCTRCGGHGHLKKECYSTGDKVYELLTEDDAVETLEPKLLEGTGQDNRRATFVSVSRQHGGPGLSQETLKPANEVAADSALRLEKDSTQRLGKKHSRKSRKIPLPEKVTTVEEALAVIASLEDEKKRKKKKKKQKEKRHRHGEGKKHNKRKDVN